MRYRPEPLGVEVVSWGRDRLDGPALMVRALDNTLSEDSSGLYLTTRLDEITLPAPFVSAEKVVALGFAPEPMRAARLSKPDAIK